LNDTYESGINDLMQFSFPAGGEDEHGFSPDRNKLEKSKGIKYPHIPSLNTSNLRAVVHPHNQSDSGSTPKFNNKKSDTRSISS
jgi:hypothetical protein